MDIYSTRTMLTAVSMMMPVNTFLKDTFFSRSNTFTTEHVDVDYYKGRRKMAPFVSPRIAGQVSERQGFTTKSFKPALVKPLRVITGDDINKRSIGETIYSVKSPDERAAEMLAQDIADLDDMITRREEWMVSQILFTGQVHMIGEGVDQVLDFDFTNKQTLSGTDVWSDQSNSDPIADLKQWRLSVIQKSGITPDIIVMASDVVDAFVNHPEVQKVMDNTRIILGKIEPRTLPNGVTYIGSISSLGLDIYSYDEWYFDEETQTEKPMVPAGSLMLGSTRARSSLLYGAVTLADAKTNNFVTFEGTRIPDSWVQKNPAARYLQINSRPLPVPHEVDSWYVATVL
ncbi:major capsid protein [Neobacillus mesonae]|uniref:major capsid protein n=1 Tax=Neobacillus mesonae TaxID=1193713 RepID=UPI002040C2D8|nr:major capsid protein [Neobacillus mesonae]MCM3567857.1 major capsid protein [Neobacillus mesonae]